MKKLLFLLAFLPALLPAQNMDYPSPLLSWFINPFNEQIHADLIVEAGYKQVQIFEEGGDMLVSTVYFDENGLIEQEQESMGGDTWSVTYMQDLPLPNDITISDAEGLESIVGAFVYFDPMYIEGKVLYRYLANHSTLAGMQIREYYYDEATNDMLYTVYDYPEDEITDEMLEDTAPLYIRDKYILSQVKWNVEPETFKALGATNAATGEQTKIDYHGTFTDIPVKLKMWDEMGELSVTAELNDEGLPVKLSYKMNYGGELTNFSLVLRYGE